MARRNKKIQSTKRWLSNLSIWVILLALILTIAAVIAALELTNTTHLFHKSVSNSPIGTNASNQAVSDKSNQPSSNSGEKKLSNTPSASQGGATDTHGQNIPSTPQNDWTISSSGLITVKSPVANSVFKSGYSISGTARVNEIQYRLVDNEVGVLAQGSISVIDGKFSASISFTHQASTGEINVFSFNANGAEVNEVQIPIKF